MKRKSCKHINATESLIETGRHVRKGACVGQWYGTTSWLLQKNSRPKLRRFRSLSSKFYFAEVYPVPVAWGLTQIIRKYLSFLTLKVFSTDYIQQFSFFASTSSKESTDWNLPSTAPFCLHTSGHRKRLSFPQPNIKRKNREKVFTFLFYRGARWLEILPPGILESQNAFVFRKRMKKLDLLSTLYLADIT